MGKVPVRAILAESAYQAIASETVNSPEVETGGLLIGRRIYHKGTPLIVVLHASGPGRSADRQVLQFAPDHERLQRELEEWRSRFATYGVDYIGEWHKHPPEIPHLSRGDVQQARRILADSSYELPDGDLLLPISRIDGDSVALDVYLVSRDLDDYICLPHEIIHLDELRQFLDLALVADVSDRLEPREPLEPVERRNDRLSTPHDWRPPQREVKVRPFTIRDYDPRKVIEGRVIGEEKREESRHRESQLDSENDRDKSDSGVDLITLRLSREVERIRRLGKRRGFEVETTSNYELLTLVLKRPIPLIPVEGVLGDGFVPSENSLSTDSGATSLPASECPPSDGPDSALAPTPKHLSGDNSDLVSAPTSQCPPGDESNSTPTPASERSLSNESNSTAVPALEHSPSDESDSTPVPALERSPSNGSAITPTPSGENLLKILVFLGDYPAKVRFWLQTDRLSKAVPVDALPRRGRSATIEQMVDELLRNLSNDLRRDGILGQLFSDLEFHTRKVVHISAATVQSAGELIAKLESDFNRGFNFETGPQIRLLRSKDVRHNT